MIYIKHLTQLHLCDTCPSVTLTTNIKPLFPITSPHLSLLISRLSLHSLLASTTWFPSTMLNETSPSLKLSPNDPALAPLLSVSLDIITNFTALIWSPVCYISWLHSPLWFHSCSKSLPFPTCHTLSYQRILSGAPCAMKLTLGEVGAWVFEQEWINKVRFQKTKD